HLGRCRGRLATERHGRAGGPGSVPARRARPARPRGKRRPATGDDRRSRPLLRRRARRPFPRPERRRTHRLDPLRRLARPVSHVPYRNEGRMSPRREQKGVAMSTTQLIHSPARSATSRPIGARGQGFASPDRPTAGERFDETAPLIGAPAIYGPPVIFLLGPWLLLVL